MKRLLIIGCGDVAQRALPRLRDLYRVSALVRSEERARFLASQGVQVVRGDLDRPDSLASMTRLEFDLVLHSAPPQPEGTGDLRTRNLLAAFKSGGMLPQRLVYLSTSGVYGDCAGAWTDESAPLNPGNERAARRVDAENQLAGWCAEHGAGLALLRVPGIYADDRLPVERLRAGMPALRAQDDVFTNHIHADDLADIACVALGCPAACGAFNASDDSEMKMADYFDLVADRFGLARPPRVSREDARRLLSPLTLSFMSESRRLVNRRMKEELGIRLRYPTVHEGVPKSPVAV